MSFAKDIIKNLLFEFTYSKGNWAALLPYSITNECCVAVVDGPGAPNNRV